MHTHDNYFRLLFTNQLQQVAENCLGGKVVGKNLQYFNKVPKVSKPTPPHQDGFYFRIKPQRAVTGWLALDPADESNGCLRYVKGSAAKEIRPHHQSGVLGFSQCLKEYPQKAKPEEDLRNEMLMVARPGDLVMHHSVMVHMAGKNETADRQRRALGFIYYAEECKVDEVAHAAYQKAISEQWKKEGRI